MAYQPGLQTDWNDFAWFLKEYIPKQTVSNLKLFAVAIQTHAKLECQFRSYDRKAEIVSRVQDAFQRMKVNNDLSAYGRARQACERMGTPTAYKSTYHAPPPTFGGVPATSHSSASGNYARPASSSTTNGYGSSYTAAGPSRSAGSNWASSSTATAYSRPVPSLLDWKPNPMWKPIRALTSIETLPDISHNENSHVRRERRTHLTLPADVIEKLNYTRDHPNAHPRYAIRLFCTSSDHYRPPGMHLYAGQIAPTNRKIPIEFPSNPDVTVDGYGLLFKEKGLRGKAGSAPPFDLEKSPNGLSKVPNRLIPVVVGHSGPTVGKKKDLSKRFFYQIVFTEMTSKEELLRRLKALEPTSVAASLAEFRKRQEEDDDIVVGTSIMSLKDPLSYMRITRPIRSSKCTHVQCFDATWWIESNAQHPQWLCPHCNKELLFPDLIVDGYVMSILDAVPDSVDDVILEPTGEWHTEDKKYGSAAWMAENGVAGAAPAAVLDTSSSPRSNDGAQDGGANANPNAKRKIVELLLSDSEDEDEKERSLSHAVNGSRLASNSASVPPPRLPPAAPSSNAAASSARSSVQPANEIIDLTLSDSDDDTDEQESSQQANFQPPGAGYTNRNAVDLRRPLQSNNKGDPVARPAHHGTAPTPASASASASAATVNAGGMTSPAGILKQSMPTSNGAAKEWDFVYESDPWANSPYSPPLPSPTTSAMGYGGSASASATGSTSKRPRADHWTSDPSYRPNSASTSANANTNARQPVGSTSQPHTSYDGQGQRSGPPPGGFAGYSHTSTAGFGAPPRPVAGGDHAGLTRPLSLPPKVGLSPSPSSELRSPVPPLGPATSPVYPHHLHPHAHAHAQAQPRPAASNSVNPNPSSDGPSSPIILRFPSASSLARLSADAATSASASASVASGKVSSIGTGADVGRVLSPGQSKMWVQTQNHLSAGETDMDLDMDNASLELGLGARSTAVSPSEPHVQITTTSRERQQPPGSVTAGLAVTGVMTEPRVRTRDADEENDDVERSSDLGLGMGGEQDEFWEGVLNGDLSLRDLQD